ncbi:glycosyltransferase family 39 protein [Dyadobacter sp. CY326]|uniref:glycosyltransferase family 39 protein n=1 Tax=Dyadobacter sp. CY326 TaxID=2907300 RepID=UPI001F405396|nr:glycosyltransferase family 39 protein [Dyadobacter sp. CY326]MCE7064561.1 glycosyltransferase family 39 protein [Dyadobacter sp. CY326]
MSFILLPFSAFLIFLVCYLAQSNEGIYSKLRVAIVQTLIACAVLAFVYNEIFSTFDGIKSASAIVFWLITATSLAAYLFYQRKTNPLRIAHLSEWKQFLQLKGMSKTAKIVVTCAGLFYIVPLLFLAIYAPPNNFDTHSYHLNRILFWVNNGNLDHFPTQHIFQLYLNVFAEYLVLHTVLLSGSDQFAGLVQFGSFIGSMAAVSLLAKKLGMKPGAQLLAAMFMLTLPIGIFESTSTQVDYVACFFFIAFVYFGFELLEKKRFSTLLAMLLSLVLGGFTKYTILIFAIPFTIYFAVRILLRYKFIYAAKVLALSIGLFLIIFTPFFLRNYALFGSVMSPPEQTRLFAEKIPVDKHGFLFTVSGIVKNASLHMSLPNTAYNQLIELGIRQFHEAIGVDIDDPALRLDWFRVRYSVHEDMAANTFHFWLMIIASLPLFFLRGRWEVKWLWLCALLGFVLFCTLLKFQLWSSRTHMPFFAIGAVLVSYIFSHVYRWKILLIAMPLFMLSSVFVYGNPNKALVPIVYLTQNFLAHIPVAICSPDPAQTKRFRDQLSSYYTIADGQTCHPLKSWPGYGERLRVFRMLDKLGYYNEDKTATVFATERDKSYFLSHQLDYESFKPLLNHIDGDRKNIGVLFRNDFGFYHYWAAAATKVTNPGQMQYIRYRREFASLPNAQKPFYYDYVLADDAGLAEKFIPKANIDTIYKAPLLCLVKLKRKSAERLLF